MRAKRELSTWWQNGFGDLLGSYFCQLNSCNFNLAQNNSNKLTSSHDFRGSSRERERNCAKFCWSDSLTHPRSVQQS